jgi:hypothetical protein
LQLDQTAHLLHADGDPLRHGTQIRCASHHDILSGKVQTAEPA